MKLKMSNSNSRPPVLLKSTLPCQMHSAPALYARIDKSTASDACLNSKTKVVMYQTRICREYMTMVASSSFSASYASRSPSHWSNNTWYSSIEDCWLSTISSASLALMFIILSLVIIMWPHAGHSGGLSSHHISIETFGWQLVSSITSIKSSSMDKTWGGKRPWSRSPKARILRKTLKKAAGQMWTPGQGHERPGATAM